MESSPKTKKKIPKSVHEMSKEKLQETLKKKKECNARALQTVEKLCEEKIDEEWFLANLQFVNQCHFDDATVERAISKICGYPLCDHKLPAQVPAQQYHISTRYNKVFDITERKNFCSSNCYKSAIYVKNQLFTSPLWFRDQEVIPKYSVLKSKSKSSMGEEVVFFPDKIKLEPEDIKKNVPVIKAVDLNESNNELEEKCSTLKIHDSLEESQNKTDIKAANVGTTCGRENNTSKQNEKSNIVKEESNAKNKCVEDSKVMNDGTTSNASKENLIKKKPIKAEVTKMKMKVEPINVIQKVEKRIFDWFSLETLFYLCGEGKLKELFEDKADEVKKIINSKLSVSNCNEKIDRMIQLYGLLDTDSFSSSDIKTNLKPLPSYSALKNEGKQFEIKVRAFYQGQFVLKPPEEVKKDEEESQTDFSPMYMPLIDCHAQIALRRKILLDKVNKVLPELIKAFSSDYVLKMSEVRNLVTTFTLAAHNITFKPSEWYLVGLILIKLLSLMDKQLESAIKSESSRSQIIMILTNYKLQEDYLDNLLLRLFDSSTWMEKLNEINK